jgi:hypothetical protein
MMGWLSKLIIVNNLGCPKYKQNLAEFLVKKKFTLKLRGYVGIF